jgi:hemerythrin-like domain-containing protein
MSEGAEPTSRLMGGDHEELNELFDEFRATPPGATERRSQVWDRFATDLRRHILVEEQLLFPAFGEGDPSRRRMVELMLDEHRRIEQVLRRIRLQLDAGPESTEELEVELTNVLWAHNAREEESVYPWFDSHLSLDLARTVRRELHTPEAKEDER